MATSFSGGRGRSTRREPPTMGKQLVNFIACAAGRVHPFCNLQSRQIYLMETDMGSRVYVYESYYFERKIYDIIGCDRCPCQL
jgi:hypothetical protein